MTQGSIEVCSISVDFNFGITSTGTKCIILWYNTTKLLSESKQTILSYSPNTVVMTDIGHRAIAGKIKKNSWCSLLQTCSSHSITYSDFIGTDVHVLTSQLPYHIEILNNNSNCFKETDLPDHLYDTIKYIRTVIFINISQCALVVSGSNYNFHYTGN